ncbi:hypothetical protein EDWATA_00952 [Edwardsiella tarda ATCC 23685]|uniref:Uncharacterized protein n=1 Tax=Edwardsiella tarda ATCC 23685 TaxID=500638 RepID=D4F2K2_EDWTA|nr:hypothetical protein EDWATA_00952 [Edwardsiella tarda ATCC 23685]
MLLILQNINRCYFLFVGSCVTILVVAHSTLYVSALMAGSIKPRMTPLARCLPSGNIDNSRFGALSGTGRHVE